MKPELSLEEQLERLANLEGGELSLEGINERLANLEGGELSLEERLG